ncbi:hypothetical protein ABK040_014426 [Willaertia magna]
MKINNQAVKFLSIGKMKQNFNLLPLSRINSFSIHSQNNKKHYFKKLFNKFKNNNTEQTNNSIKLNIVSEFQFSPEQAYESFYQYAKRKNKWFGPTKWYKPDYYPQPIYLPFWVFQYGEACAYKVKVRLTLDISKQKHLMLMLLNKTEEEIKKKLLEKLNKKRKQVDTLTQLPEDFLQRDLKEKKKEIEELEKILKLNDEKTLRELVGVIKTILMNQFQIQENSFEIISLNSKELVLDFLVDHIKLNEYLEQDEIFNSVNSLQQLQQQKDDKKEELKKIKEKKNEMTFVDGYTSVYASTQFEHVLVKRVIDNLDPKYLIEDFNIKKISYQPQWYEQIWNNIKTWFSNNKTNNKKEYNVDYYTIDWETAWSLTFDKYIPDTIELKLNKLIKEQIEDFEDLDNNSTYTPTLLLSPKIEVNSFELEKTDFKIHKKEMRYIPFYIKQDTLFFPDFLFKLAPYALRKKVEKLSHGRLSFYSFMNGIDGNYITGYVPYSFVKVFLTNLITFNSVIFSLLYGWSTWFYTMTLTSNLIWSGSISFLLALSSSIEQYYKPFLHLQKHKKLAVKIHNKYIANKPLQRLYFNAWKFNQSNYNNSNDNQNNLSPLALEIHKGCDLYTILELDTKVFALYTQEEIRQQYRKLAMLYHPDLHISSNKKKNTTVSGEMELQENSSSSVIIMEENKESDKKEEEEKKEMTEEEIIERFKQINYAFQILGHPQSRELYHKHGITYFQYMM